MSDPSSLTMVIDQGGHASRTVIFDQHQSVVASHFEAIDTKRYDTGRIEHDPEELISSIQKAIIGVSDSLGDRKSDLKRIGIATQRSSIVCWDKHNGGALSPVISWQDRRTSESICDYFDHEERIHRLTGLVLSPHYGATKIHWCLEKIHEVQEAYQQKRLACGPLSSFILFRLLNERPFVVDPANASRTLLWNYLARNWDPELLDIFDIPLDILPQSVPSRYEFGHITVASRPVPVSVVTGDQSAALYAFGRPNLDTTYINVGTGAFLQRPVGSSPVAADNLLSSLVWQSEDSIEFVLEGSVNGAGSALHLFASESGINDKELHDQITNVLASEIGPPLYLNGVSGLGSPFWVADFPSQFIGEGNQDEKLVAVIESIVFLIIANLDEMSRLASPSEVLIVTGGLSAMDGLCKRLADLSGIPVKRPELEEATAQGVAYLVAGASEKSTTFKSFIPSSHHPLKQRYQKWLAEIKIQTERVAGVSNKRIPKTD